jgi:molybdopterin molybdotransferase
MKTIAQIAAELQGYDPQALPANAVLDFLQRLVTPVTESNHQPLFDALGKVLSADVISPLNVPPHDNSAMDGYAFDGSQLQVNGRLQLKVVGTALAGKAWAGTAGPGDCVKIMTGAIMPAGFDTVAPQEIVTQLGGETAFIVIPAGMLTPGDNRRLRGEDLAQGHPALLKGQVVTPARLSLGEPPREGAVYDSNRYTTFGLLKRLGCEVIDLGVVKDDPVLLEAAFRTAAAQADAIITSGGVSVGEADYTKAMMKKLGDVAFWRIAMRPGRPMAVGRIASESNAKAGAVLFGLPGNPVAVMVTFLAFVRPALRQMMGCTDSAAPLLKAHSQETMRKKSGRTEYQRGWVSSATDGSLQVRTTGNQGSGVLSSMAEANGLIVLHHDQGNVGVGDLLDVMMFNGAI